MAQAATKCYTTLPKNYMIHTSCMHMFNQRNGYHPQALNPYNELFDK